MLFHMIYNKHCKTIPNYITSFLHNFFQQSVFELLPTLNCDLDPQSVGVRRSGRRGYLELLYLQSCGNPSLVWEI